MQYPLTIRHLAFCCNPKQQPHSPCMCVFILTFSFLFTLGFSHDTMTGIDTVCFQSCICSRILTVPLILSQFLSERGGSLSAWQVASYAVPLRYCSITKSLFKLHPETAQVCVILSAPLPTRFYSAESQLSSFSLMSPLTRASSKEGET